MDKITKLQVEERELAVKLAELSAKDELTDEQRTEQRELVSKSITVKDKINAETIANDQRETKLETGEDGEATEFRGLVDKAKVFTYVEGAIEYRGIKDGPELELNQALKMGADKFPLVLLAPEMRTKTSGDPNVSRKRWVDRLFDDSTSARYIGVTFDSVGSGNASYLVTSAGGTGKQRGREESATASSHTVGITELQPTRNSVSLSFNMEDATRMQGLEDALVRDMRASVMAAIDTAIIKGDSGANENSADITGFQTAGITEQTITQANKVKGPESLSAFLEMVDGKHANELTDLKVIVSVGAYRLWASTRDNASADNSTVKNFLNSNGVTFRARGGIDTATSNGDFGGFAGRQIGITGAAVAPIWQAGSLIRDPYSGSKAAKTELSLHYLWAFGIPRTSNYQRVKFVT